MASALGGVASTARAGVPPVPIPEGPGAGALPQFVGSAARAHPVSAPQPPQNPFMAPNGRRNVHDDAYMTDTYAWSGPLGKNIERSSTYQNAECGTLTFDHAGRIVAICVGLEGPRLEMFDPRTLELLAAFPLPPRTPGGTSPFSDFSGGGYFYLDDRDRAVIPTNSHQIWVVRETDGPGFALERAYDVNATVTPDDKLVSALPDWSGRIWFVSSKGVVGTVDPATGATRSRDTTEPIGN